MLRAFHAPITKLQKLYLPLHFLFVFLAPIVDSLALLAGEFDEAVLGHNQKIKR